MEDRYAWIIRVIKSPPRGAIVDPSRQAVGVWTRLITDIGFPGHRVFEFHPLGVECRGG